MRSGPSKLILCLDFDGVLHSYTSGWKGAAVVADPVVPGAVEFLAEATRVFDVQVFSSRSGQPGGLQAMQEFLDQVIRERYGNGDSRDFEEAYRIAKAISFPLEKPAALVTLDDRAITFEGKWPSVAELRAFKPWNKRGEVKVKSRYEFTAWGAIAETSAAQHDDYEQLRGLFICVLVPEHGPAVTGVGKSADDAYENAIRKLNGKGA